MNHRDFINSVSLPKVPQEELFAYTDYDDFLRRYGNPVIVKSEGHGDMICMAREYYERLVLDLEYSREQDPADYWIYEFSATEAKKLEIEKVAAQHGMTIDEYLVGTIEKAMGQVRFDLERQRPYPKSGEGIWHPACPVLSRI